jgi:hypothetical protein
MGIENDMSPAEEYQAAAAAVMSLRIRIEEVQVQVLNAVRSLGTDPLGLMETSGTRDADSPARRHARRSGLIVSARVHAQFAAATRRTWTPEQLTAVMPDPRSTIGSACSRLAAAGLAEKVDVGGRAGYRWKRNPTKAELGEAGQITEALLKRLRQEGSTDDE